MSLGDLEIAMGWARSEGWNPGLDDAAAFLVADPGGFLIGRVDDAPASSISLVRYGAEFAFLGLYIVAPEHRGRGLGHALWRQALDALPPHVVVGLDGVVAQQESYARSGFVLAHRNARWGGTFTTLPDESPAVRELAPDDLASVVAYESDLFPAPRESFLATWLTGSRSRRAVGFVEDGHLLGYGCIRRCWDGWKVGPLFADSPEIADALFAALAAPVAPGPVFLDVPEPNEAATALATSLGFSRSFETARMYRGQAPALDLTRVFGITTLELG